MKRFLSILGLLTICSTTSLSAISCDDSISNKDYVITAKGEIMYNFKEKHVYVIG